MAINILALASIDANFSFQDRDFANETLVFGCSSGSNLHLREIIEDLCDVAKDRQDCLSLTPNPEKCQWQKEGFYWRWDSFFFHSEGNEQLPKKAFDRLWLCPRITKFSRMLNITEAKNMIFILT